MIMVLAVGAIPGFVATLSCLDPVLSIDCYFVPDQCFVWISLPQCPDSFISAALSYKQKIAESHDSLGYNKQAKNFYPYREIFFKNKQPEPNIKKSSLILSNKSCMKQLKQNNSGR